MKNRRFSPDAWHHVYVISQDGGVLFYRVTDRLSFFTVLSVISRRYGVEVVGVSIMFTHIHLMVRAADLAQLRAFMQQLLCAFSRIANEDRGLAGTLFKRPFGSAPKSSPKERRSSLIYLYNNPVEKKLCSRAVEDRWTFLAYGQGMFPFSRPLVKRNVRYVLRQACDVIDSEFRAGRFLRPARLRGLFTALTREEREQLTDYIIQRYQFVRFDEAVWMFADYDAMLRATEVSSGKEFDVGEVFDPSSDVPYREMCAIAARSGLFEEWKLLHLSEEEQRQWVRKFHALTGATDRQIRKFLHLAGAQPGERWA